MEENQFEQGRKHRAQGWAGPGKQDERITAYLSEDATLKSVNWCATLKPHENISEEKSKRRTGQCTSVILALETLGQKTPESRPERM